MIYRRSTNHLNVLLPLFGKWSTNRWATRIYLVPGRIRMRILLIVIFTAFDLGLDFRQNCYTSLIVFWVAPAMPIESKAFAYYIPFMFEKLHMTSTSRFCQFILDWNILPNPFLHCWSICLHKSRRWFYMWIYFSLKIDSNFDGSTFNCILTIWLRRRLRGSPPFKLLKWFWFHITKLWKI